MSTYRGWHSRGYIPHFDSPEVIQMVTFRQADSLPADKVHLWNKLLKDRKNLPVEERRRLVRLVDQYLDAGYGSAIFGRDEAASLMENALLHFDGLRYRLYAWVVMPNHVHVLFEPGPDEGLRKILHSWKSFTGHRLSHLVVMGQPVWQEEYFDRFVRDEDHFYRAVEYIEMNPVKAGLCESPFDWRYSSARLRLRS